MKRRRYPQLRKKKRCKCGKRIMSQIEATGIALDPRRIEKNAYKCPICKGWHVTKKNGRLTELSLRSR